MTGSSPLLAGLLALLPLELGHLYALYLARWRCGGCAESPRACGEHLHP